MNAARVLYVLFYLSQICYTVIPTHATIMVHVLKMPTDSNVSVPKDLKAAYVKVRMLCNR